MFGKTLKQRLQEYKSLNQKNEETNDSGLKADQLIGSSDDFTADDYMDFNDNFDGNEDFDYARDQFEHFIDMQDIEVEIDNEDETEQIQGVPLFEGSKHSVTEFAMALMGLSRENNFTDASVNQLLNLFRIFLPNSNKVPATYSKIKNIVKENSNGGLVEETTVICASCLTDMCECRNLNKAIFIKFDLHFQLNGLFSRNEPVMVDYRNKMLCQNEFTDCQQGKIYREALEKTPNMLPMSLYTDGGRYTKTGAYEGWPIVVFALDLPPKLRFKYSNIIFLGYWYSKKKPDWDFVFKKIGPLLPFSFNGRVYRIKYLQVIADIPARQSLLSMINVPGYDSCFNCDIHGVHVGHMIFPFVETNPRDPNTYLDKTKGVNGLSAIYHRIENFPDSVTIDIMHSVYRGPMQDDLKRLVTGFRRNANERLLIKLSSDGIKTLDLVLSKLQFPEEYQRDRIRSINVLSTWKASEIKLFGLYIVPTALCYVASLENNNNIPELVESMVMYTAAIRLLIQTKITKEMIETSEDILKFWAENRQRLWTSSAMTFKAHESLHLPRQVLLHGGLSTHSAFAGESAIGQIGKNISCFTVEVSAKQISERLDLRRACLSWLEVNGTPEVKRYFNKSTSTRIKRIPEPSDDITAFLNDNMIHGNYCHEIQINGFAISPYRTSNSRNCYVSIYSQGGFMAIKVMAIIKCATGDIYFCGHPLKTLPYSNLMNKNGFLASKQFVYRYCCYGDKNDFEQNELLLCKIENFLAKYVFIEVFSFNFLMTMPHAYEHN